MGQGFEYYHQSSSKVYDVVNKDRYAEFKTTTFFINNTDIDVTVIHRNNLPVKIPRSTGYFGGGGSFTIRTVYDFNNREQIIETINVLERLYKGKMSKTGDIELLLALMHEKFSHDRAVTWMTIALDREIPVKALKHHSKLYVPESDLLLCDDRCRMPVLHPYSDDGLLLEGYRASIQDRAVTGVFLELIDNENSIGERYMYLAKQLVPVPAKVDKARASGLYFTLADSDRLGELHLEPRYLSFEEAQDEVGLYKTREEAMSGGNPEVLSRTEEERAKRELAELRRRADLEKVASDQAKAENDRYRAETERQIAELNRELENRKLETKRLTDELDLRKQVRADYYEDRRSHRNDHYEDRSYHRKNDHELLKMAGIAVATGFSVWLALQKNQSKK